MSDLAHNKCGKSIHKCHDYRYEYDQANLCIDKCLSLPTIDNILPVCFEINLVDEKIDDDHAGQIQQETCGKTNRSPDRIGGKELEKVPAISRVGVAQLHDAGRKLHVDLIKYVNDHENTGEIKHRKHLEYPVILDFHPFNLKVSEHYLGIYLLWIMVA